MRRVTAYGFAKAIWRALHVSTATAESCDMVGESRSFFCVFPAMPPQGKMRTPGRRFLEALFLAGCGVLLVLSFSTSPTCTHAFQFSPRTTGRRIRSVWNRQLIKKPVLPLTASSLNNPPPVHTKEDEEDSRRRRRRNNRRKKVWHQRHEEGDDLHTKPLHVSHHHHHHQARHEPAADLEESSSWSSDVESLKLFFERHDPFTPSESPSIEVNQQHSATDLGSPNPTNHVEVASENDHADSQQRQFRIPQIHLPPRLVPRIGWEHHHQATTNFVHSIRGNGHQKEDSDEASLTISKGGDEEPDSVFHVAVDASVSDDMPTFIATHKKNDPQLVSSTQAWKRLEAHAHSEMNRIHLRDMLMDEVRTDAMVAEYDGVYLDYSRQRANLKTLELLRDLADKQQLRQKIQDMVNGKKINFTEKRAVLHTALRADRDHPPIMVDGVNAIEEVHQVLDQVKQFTHDIRSGQLRGYTGKRIRNIISVGIGGSFLGPEFLHEVLKTEPEGINSALGYSLRFLANVDPVDVERTCADLDPEETLIVIVSKTFTTAETMLNAKTMRQWLWDFMGDDPRVVQKHFVACASVSATDKVEEFGIDTSRYFFRFWDWVGGRYSVCSAAGAVPISLLYGFDLFEKFLKGANSIDKHFVSAPFEENIPVIMGMLGVWNMSFMKYKTRTTLPYAEALLKLPAHIQQLDMESNGKVMTKYGVEVDYPVGEIDFGEPGTNGQHSFFQLLHMGQTCPCDFIGFVQSQHDLCLDGERLSSHDELMANFFAQPDALATGKTASELRAEGCDEELIPHRTFKGNRPSMSLLLPKLTAYAAGQLLAIYEHRTAVQGFLWDINSFDQWGVELGKQLAVDVKEKLLESRATGKPIQANNPAATRILNYYAQNSRPVCDDILERKGTNAPVNPMTRVTRKSFRDHHRPPDRHDLGGHTGRL